MPKERIYYKLPGKFIHLMCSPNAVFRNDDSEIAVCIKKQLLPIELSITVPFIHGFSETEFFTFHLPSLAFFIAKWKSKISGFEYW